MAPRRGSQRKGVLVAASGVLCLACWHSSSDFQGGSSVTAFQISPSYTVRPSSTAAATSSSSSSSAVVPAFAATPWVTRGRAWADASIRTGSSGSGSRSGSGGGSVRRLASSSSVRCSSSLHVAMDGAISAAAIAVEGGGGVNSGGYSASAQGQYPGSITGGRRRRALPELVTAMGVLSPKALKKVKKQGKEQQKKTQLEQAKGRQADTGTTNPSSSATTSTTGTTTDSSNSQQTTDMEDSEQIYFSDDLQELDETATTTSTAPPPRTYLEVSLDNSVMPAPLNPCLVTASVVVMLLGSIAVLSRITLIWEAFAIYISEALSQVAYALGLSDALDAVRYRCRLIGGSIQAWYDGVRSAWDKAFGPEEIRLPANDWSICVLDERVKMGDKFMRYRFRYQAPNYVLPLELGQEIMLCGLDGDNGNGNVASASFQPLSSRHALGYFDIVVQRDAGYLSQGPGKGQQAQFVRLLDTLAIGDELAVKPGRPCLNYRGPYSPITDVVMIATGLGIVPMLQMIDELLPSRESSVHSTSVIWMNEHADDFALYNKLEKAFYKHHRKLDVSCVIERDLYGHNIASNPKVCEAIPDFKIGTMAVISGPDYFTRKVQDYLERQGYPEEVLVAF